MRAQPGTPGIARERGTTAPSRASTTRRRAAAPSPIRASTVARSIATRPGSPAPPPATSPRPPPAPRPGVPVRRDRLAAGPASRLVEQRVLVEVGVAAELIGRRGVAEEGPDRGREDLAEVEVDGPQGSMEVDLLVEEETRAEEALEGRDAGLVDGQASVRDVRV